MNYLTEPEAAEKLRTDRKRLATWRKAGLIKGVKLSRSYVYRESDLDEFYDEYYGKDLSADHYKNFVKKEAK